jgi:uncharacterized membrane protein YphA (DoxX/SURF4 family)
MLLSMGIAGVVIGTGLAIVATRTPSRAVILEWVGGALLVAGLLALGAAFGWAIATAP